MSRIVRQISAKKIQRWNTILSFPRAAEGTKHGEVIEEFDIKLFKGKSETYVVQFKLVNGDKEAGPYLDVILLDDGSEVFVCDPCFERLDTEFKMRDTYLNKEYTLVLEARKKK